MTHADKHAPLARIAVSARDVIGTGGGTVSIETSRHFAERGHEVHFVVDTDVPRGLEGVRLHVTAFGNALKRWQPRGRISFRIRHCLQVFLFSLLGGLQVRRLERQGFVSLDHNIESFGAHVLVLHNVFIAQYRADRRHWLKKIPQFFNPVFGFRLLREQWAFRSPRTRAVIAVSEQTLEEARPYLRAGLRHEVIHNGINLVRYSPCPESERRALKAELGAPGRFVLLFVGHEFERKRLDLVIAALALMPEDVCLWVIGGRGSSHDAYKRIGADHGVAERVSFLGTVADTERYFRAADAFVLPSDYETWGLVVLEAMACGTPAVMTAVGCAPHVIRDGETGFVVDYTAREIADRLLQLHADPGLHARMRAAARAMAEAYAWEKVAARYLDVVQSLHARSTHGA